MAARARLSDIAELAGVSAATVSRVLNGKGIVAEQTRRAVLTALDQLGYERPERLRLRHAGLIGLIVPELSNPVFPAFAQRLESYLSDAGYTPLLCTQSPGGVSEQQYVDLLMDRNVDGIIFVSGLHADPTANLSHVERLLAVNTPFVVVNGTNPALPVPAFAVDERHAMEMAVRHLYSLGHRRIGLALGQERYFPSQLKLAGYRTAMAAYPDCGEPVVAASLYTQEGGRAAAAELLAAGCSAIVAASDLMALGAIAHIRSRGLSVPTDISVIGFDDSPLMAHTNPPLTTLRQPVDSMSRSVVTTLLNMVAGNPAPATEILFEPELIVRGSTGSLRNQ